MEMKHKATPDSNLSSGMYYCVVHINQVVIQQSATKQTLLLSAACALWVQIWHSIFCNKDFYTNMEKTNVTLDYIELFGPGNGVS